MNTYYSREGRMDYSPALLGNGEISLQLDFMGQQVFEEKELDTCETPPARSVASPNIWWAGRRYVYDSRRFLIPFGQMLANIEGLPVRPAEWNQTLDTQGAKVCSECLYEEGEKINVDAFIHHDMNLLAIRRKFNLKEKRAFQLSYRLRSNNADNIVRGDPLVWTAPSPLKHSRRDTIDPDNTLPRYMEIFPSADPVTGGWRIRYTVDGQWDYEGVILLFADRPLKRGWTGNVFTLSGEAKDEEVTLYLILRDNVDEENYEETAVRQAMDVLCLGYDGMYTSHKAGWDAYYAESHVQLSDENLMKVYRAAQYDLKCFTTRWSIPVGLNDMCWEGKYYAYDEYFAYIGLLTGNHMELAGRVPRFRNQVLPTARQRVTDTAVRYPWITVETGEEASTPAAWVDHVFHMANVTVGAWEYYAYTKDEGYLREIAWPIMLPCTEFYRRYMIFRVEGGKTIVGPCTDWERLGTAVRNAYMTTCGVIYTLQLTARAGRILGYDPQYIEECETIAAELYDGLPNNGERYLPHPLCGEQRSIGVFGGMFPYHIMEKNNPLQQSAIEDYQKFEGTYGNMYAVGSGVSAWFAAWKGIAYARLHEPERAMTCVRQAASSQGCFGELFEINEETHRFRPWFSTANGIYMAAVHNALIQSNDGMIELLPGYAAEEGDVSFELSVEGDLTVSICVSGGCLKHLSLKPGKRCSYHQITLRLPNWLSLQTAQIDDGGLTIIQIES